MKSELIHITFLILLAFCTPANSAETSYEANHIRTVYFVDIKDMIPSIFLDIRYFTNNNFVGERINGYLRPKCLLSREAAKALVPVQAELLKQDLSLKIYDCYRPQRAVDHFVLWAKDIGDTKMKNIFYPGVDKKDLFKKGYIANLSGHSRGSTLDLTITKLPPKSNTMSYADEIDLIKDIDMGTPYDFFDPLSHTDNTDISNTAQYNRHILKEIMEAHGFKNLKEEWWHYTLKDEPFPDQYFDFPIE